MSRLVARWRDAFTPLRYDWFVLHATHLWCVPMIGLFSMVEARLSFDLARLVVQARKDADLKHDALAALMGISGKQLSHQLAERGHLSLRRLLFVATDKSGDGRRFLAALWPLLAQEIGLEDRALANEAARLAGLLERFLTQTMKAGVESRKEQAS